MKEKTLDDETPVKLTEEDIKKIFYEKGSLLLSKDKFYKKIKAMDPTVKQKAINKFYMEQEINQIVQTVKKPKKFNTVTANYAGDKYQIDILVYKKHEIHKYKYILVILDVYSRYLEAVAMTNRENENIIKYIMKIFDIMGTPYKIQCDNEFNTVEFNKLMDSMDIRVHYSDPNEINKNALVERSNRTLRFLLNKYREANKDYNWVEYLQDVVQHYNNTEHDGTKNTPKSIWDGHEYNEQKIVRFDSNFVLGDRVRKLIKKQIFDKVDSMTHSKDVYTIMEVKKNRYLLNDGSLLYYKPYEIVKANTVIYKDAEPDQAIEPAQVVKKRYIIPEKENIVTRSRSKPTAPP